jgi:iron complex outermembrane receptor protein
MNWIPRAVYTKEFREEAVKLASSVGASEAARRLSIPLKSLANWMRAAKGGKLDKVGAQQKPLTEVEQELNRVGASLLDATGTNGLTAPTGFAIQPEKVLDLELGAKTALLDKTLVLNLNLYYTRIKDYQQTLSAVDTVASAATGVTSFYNYVGDIPRVTLRGLEIDGSYAVGRSLLLSFGGAYNHAVYSDFKNAPCPTEITGQLDPVTGKTAAANQTCDHTGKQLPFAPKLSGVMGADYLLPLLGSYRLHLFGNSVYRSKANYAGNLSAYGEQGAYWLFDGGIGIQAGEGKWELAVVGRNLRDQHYVTLVTPFTANAEVTGASGERRNIGVVLRGKL